MSASSRKTGAARFHSVTVKDAAAWLRDYLTAIKHGQFHPYTPLERKVREATRNEAWGPTGTILNELAEASCESDLCQIIYAVLETRLKYPPEKWRNVYKSLQVLEFLMKRGSDQCVALARGDIQPHIKNVKDFEYTGSDGRDYGINVRVRAAAILRLLNSEQELQQERAQLQRRAKQFKGYSREDLERNRELAVGTAHSWPAGRVLEDRDIGRAHVRQEQQGSDRIVRSRQAGQTKGVSEEERVKNQRRLQILLASKGNRRCADCISDERPTWASINCGVFICMKCAGIHRGLGVHVSQVRSCNLDSWKTEEVEFMSRTGNRVANSFWEAKMPPKLKPRGDDPNLASFIRRKYQNREWADGAWPPEKPSVQDEHIQPAVAGAPEAQVTAGPHIAKHQHLKPPQRVTFVGKHTPLEISGGPFKEAATVLDRSPVPAEFDDAGAKPAIPAPVRAMSADPLRPSEPVIAIQEPQSELQLSGIIRTQTFPDLMEFGDDPYVLCTSSPVPPVEHKHQPSEAGPSIDPVAALADLDYHPSLLDTWMYDSSALHKRDAVLESVDSAEVIRTTELVDEEDSIIQTTELKLDDTDPQLGLAFVNSADARLQTPPMNGDFERQGPEDWMDVHNMNEVYHTRQPLNLGRSAGQKKDTREGRSGMDRGPLKEETATPHVSVTLTVTDNERGNRLSAASEPSTSQASHGLGTGQLCHAAPDPDYSLETVASVRGMGQFQQHSFGGTPSTFQNAGIMNRQGNVNQDPTANPFSPTWTQPQYLPEHLRNRHQSAVTPAYRPACDPIPDFQPLGGPSRTGTVGLTSGAAPSAPVTSSTPYVSSAWTAHMQGPGHGFSVNDVRSGLGEVGSNATHQFSSVFVSPSHGQPHLSYNVTDQLQMPSMVFASGVDRSGLENSPAPGDTGGYHLPNAMQPWVSMGRHSHGGAASSGSASDELERLLFEQVESLARENERIAARAARLTVSPHRGMSMRERRSQLGGAPGSPSSGSTGRSLPVGVE